MSGVLGEELRAGEQRLRQMFGAAPCGLIATSLDPERPHRYLAVNDAYRKLTGYSDEELHGGDFLGDVHPDDQAELDALAARIIAGQTTVTMAHARLVSKDGRIVHARLTGSAITAPSGERYLATHVEDVTALEQARESLRQVEAELARSRRLESIGQLIDGIGHDFNNMLTVISNYASLVRDEVTVAEAAEGTTRWGPVRWDVAQIEDAAERARRLVTHMLAFARRDEAEPAVVDLGQAIADAGHLLGDVLGENIDVITDAAPGLWPVRVDQDLLEQAIINLAVNARDAMKTGGQLQISADNIDTAAAATAAAGPGQDQSDAAQLSELLPGRYARLRIADTGAGMETAIAERAFDPFFTTKGAGQAAGLGLPAVRRFAAQAGGNAWLRSAPGAGTTVTIALPAAGPATAQSGQAPGGTILVVDDEAAIRDVAHRVLASAGYAVITAPNGQEALAMLKDRAAPVDVILSDVIMPGLTADAFAARVGELSPGTLLIFMSGYQRPEDSAAGWPREGVPVIAKPFSRAALLARVSQLIASSAARAAHPAGRGSRVQGS